MSTPREGQTVSYVGLPERGLDVGDKGRTLSCSGSSSHVMWTTGHRVDLVDLIHHDDLVVQAKAATRMSTAGSLEDTLSVPSLSMVAVRETLEESGEAGLLNALADTGCLGFLVDAADEALAMVASRVRADEGFALVLSHLDCDEAERLVELTAAVVLRDAFGSSDG